MSANPNATLLWLSDNPTFPGGYARVTHELLLGLQNRGYKVWCIGRGYDGWPYDHSKHPYPILPTRQEYYGSAVLTNAVDLLSPKCLIAVGDLWMLKWIKHIKLKAPLVKIAYIPIDGGPLPYSTREDYEQFDKLVTASEFGAAQLYDLLPNAAVDVIYHGVDTSVFRPLTGKHLLKRQYGVEGKFVIGCVARNQVRKQFPSLFKAFAKFHTRFPESVLFLHTCREDTGWALEDFATCFGLNGAIVYTQGIDVNHGLSDEKLNEIYNLFDVMALPTAGEGFGLPILEAMAAGIPVIATNYSACSELLAGRGILVDVKDFIYLGTQIIQNALPDVEDFYSKLCGIYSDAELRFDLSVKGREFAESYTWDSIVTKWNVLIESEISKGASRGTCTKQEVLL